MAKKCETKKIKESTLPKEIQELFKKTGRQDPTTKKYKKGTAEQPHIVQAIFNCSRDDKLSLWEQLELLIYAFQYEMDFPDVFAVQPQYKETKTFDEKAELLVKPQTWDEYYCENFKDKTELPLKFVKGLLDAIASGFTARFARDFESGKSTGYNGLKRDFEFLWDMYKNHLPPQKGKKLISLSSYQISDLYGSYAGGKKSFAPLEKTKMYHSVLTKAQRVIQERGITKQKEKKVIILAFLYKQNRCTLCGENPSKQALLELLHKITKTEKSKIFKRAKRYINQQRKHL